MTATPRAEATVRGVIDTRGILVQGRVERVGQRGWAYTGRPAREDGNKRKNPWQKNGDRDKENPIPGRSGP